MNILTTFVLSMYPDPFFIPQSLNCGGTLVSLERPVILGILNLTTDSFYKDSRVIREEEILDKAGQMISEGARFLDLGAMSTRPGAPELEEEVEKERLQLACSCIRSRFPEVLLSIDTYRVSVLEAIYPYGIHLVNDISGGGGEIWDWAAHHKLPYILMHMKGTPRTMNSLTQYDDLIREMLDYFIQRIPLLLKKGIHDLILDPGFGFAKTVDQNYVLLKNLHVFKLLEFPILVGLSRKSMIWRTLGAEPEDALHGTTALHMQALNAGARLLRVHDVRAANDTIKVWEKLQRSAAQNT